MMRLKDKDGYSLAKWFWRREGTQERGIAAAALRIP